MLQISYMGNTIYIENVIINKNCTNKMKVDRLLIEDHKLVI